jgi:hypothetical protein
LQAGDDFVVAVLGRHGLGKRQPSRVEGNLEVCPYLHCVGMFGPE